MFRLALLTATWALTTTCAPRKSLHLALVLPPIMHYDTRSLQTLHWASALIQRAREHYKQAQADSLENALCLYGHITADTLHVDSAETPHHVFERTRNAVSYYCAPDLAYIGRLHTHLALPDNGGRPWAAPSSLDFLSFWADTRDILMIVAAGFDEEQSLLAFWVIRDGRWGLSQWAIES